MTRPTITLMLPEYRVDQSMGGIGVRALDLATAMSTRADVTIVSNQVSDLPNLPCPVLPAKCADLRSLVARSDVVVFFDLGNVDLLRHAVATDRYIVVENAVPLEHLEYNADQPTVERDARYMNYVTGFRAQILAADHFLTRSEIERRVLVGVLALEGRITPGDISTSPCLEQLITRAPIGICSRDLLSNTTLAPTPGYFLWTGGLWDYMAYETAIEAFSGPESTARLCFLYRPPSDQHLRAHDVFTESALQSNRITFLDRDLPHTERGEVIEQASGLICVARPGIENETCVRLRVRDTLLYRRPIIVDLNGATGEYVRATGIGIALTKLTSKSLSVAVSQMTPGSEQYQTLLAAIERERRETVLDRRIDGFFRAGSACNWKSTRDRARVLARLGQIASEGLPLNAAPFLT